MNKGKSLYIVLLLVSFPWFPLCGQREARDFDQEKLESLWASGEFDQTKADEKVPFYGVEPITDQGENSDPEYGDADLSDTAESEFTGVNGELAVKAMYVLAGGFLLLIIFFVLKNTIGGSGQKLYTGSLPDLEIEGIHALDTKALIAEAIANADYRLAVRLNYLEILKKLDENQWIKWVANKTNQDYVAELSSHEFGMDFRTLTHHFDYAWYGDFPIGENLYTNLADQFKQFQLKIEGK